MKSRFLKTSIGSIIFLTLVIAVIALIQPIYKNIMNFMSGEESRIICLLNEKTGLSVSYESLSPSVLSGINVRGIVMSDDSSGKKVIEIKKALLSYRLVDYLLGKRLSAIKLLSLDGVSIEYDAVTNAEILKKFKMAVGGTEKEKEKEKDKKSESKKTAFSFLSGQQIDLPFDVLLKNISLHYADSVNDFSALIKNIFLERSYNFEDGIKLKTAGRFDYTTSLLKNGGRRSLVSCGIDISGTVFRNWDGSFLALRLYENPRADYTVSRVDLLLNYASSKINLRTASTTLPYSFAAETDFVKRSLKASASAEKLDLFKIIKIKNSPARFSDFTGSYVSGKSDFALTLAPDSSVVDSINFAVLGKTVLVNKKADSPIEISVDMEGDENYVTVRKFCAEGKSVNANLNGVYDVKKCQPSGVLELNKLVLLNGGVLQTEVYIDPYKNGFMCFAPQLFMDDRSLTALQLTVLPSSNSADFSFEFDDYSHVDYEKSAHISVDGSFIGGKNKSVQASVSVDDMFLDSLILTAAFFMKGGISSTLKNLSGSLSTYIFSDELYFSSDFKSFSFNSPVVILANTAREREILAFALDGSNQTVSLSNFDLQYGKQTAHASAGIDFASGFDNFNFYSDVVVNSLPYRFSGSYNSDWLTIGGDYSFEASVSFMDGISGAVNFASLPFAVGKNVFAVSTSASFNWTERSGISLELLNFELDEPSGHLAFKPHLAFSGSASRYGFVFNRIAYSDTSSVLDAKGSVLWNMNDGIFDSILVDFSASSLIGHESLKIGAELKNPEKLPFSFDNLKNDFYLSAQGAVKSFPVARLMHDQNSENTINGDFSASGTVSNPFFTLNIQKSSVNLAGYPAVFSGSAVYDDTGLNATNINATWSFLSASDGTIFFDAQTKQGELYSVLSGSTLENSFKIPLTIKIEGVSGTNEKNRSYIISAISEKMTGSFFPKPAKLDLVATKTPGRLDILSDGGKGFSATVLSDGFISAKSGISSLVNFSLAGSVVNNNFDINITGISSDLKRFCENFTIPYVKFIGGNLTGALRISGITTDPEFTGAFSVTKPEFYVPIVSKRLFKTEKVFALAGQNMFTVKPTTFLLDKKPVDVGLSIIFDRWGLESMDVSVVTSENNFVPVDMLLPLVHYKGYAGFNLGINLVPGTVSFIGKIIGQKADISFNMNNIPAENENQNAFSMNFLVDLDLYVRNRVQVLYNPLMRGVVVPDTPLKLFLDTRTDSIAFKGDISLRGGEIVWLNRNFYMKEGSMHFNETQDKFDPRLTVRAETRERDDNGNQVTITLSAINQSISSFNPRFTATPAKSEKEIMELLGQVVSADSDNAAVFAMAGGDYIVQATVMRGIENALRELCNFDIFSIRTNILQNAVKQSLSKNSSDNQFTVGNFFDNSAVYVGKYFGSVMYVDALMHWTYDESKLDDDSSVNGLVFQPEFGLEMASPYVNIRLGVAPELEAIRNSMWMPSTSITLSWKHSF